MKQSIINPTVFAYTLYVKFQDRRNLLPLLMLTVLPISMLIIPSILPHEPFTADAQKQSADMIGAYFRNPMIGMIACYFFISDGPAARKLVAESDSLALLFTRPLTRFTYVLSKFCAGAIGNFITLSIGLILSYIVGVCVGLNAIDIGPLVFASFLLNAASWAALTTFFHSTPPLAAILTYIFLVGTSGLGEIFVRAEYSNDPFVETLKTICLFLYKWLGDIVPAPIYLPTLLSAASFDIYEVAIYISNISLFLLFAAFALSKREFSYGSD